MSSTPPAEPLPLTRLLSRPALLSGAALACAVVLAWAWLIGQHHAMSAQPEAMAGMDMAGMEGMEHMPGMAMAPPPEVWSAGYLAPAFVMWALMMVAMMLPSAAPMILLHARIDRGTAAQRARDHALFVACYLVVWAAFSALATLAQAALIARGVLSAAGLTLGSRELSAAVLVAAAAWQLTPVKQACLDQCQSPLQFVMRYWKPGAAGAVRLGLAHGAYCVGCCWGVMLLLFVGGVMSLAWIALLGAVVMVEKFAPPSWRISRLLALALGVAALAVLLGGVRA